MTTANHNAIQYLADFPEFEENRRMGHRTGCLCGREGHATENAATRCAKRNRPTGAAQPRVYRVGAVC